MKGVTRRRANRSSKNGSRAGTGSLHSGSNGSQTFARNKSGHGFVEGSKRLLKSTHGDEEDDSYDGIVSQSHMQHVLTLDERNQIARDEIQNGKRLP